MAAGNIGTITRISGPVVDIQFPENVGVPDIFHALEVTIHGDVHVLECLQQLGHGAVRCISMRPTDGMSRGMRAVDTGAPMRVNMKVTRMEPNGNRVIIGVSLE